mmetsp:Transcript_42598/g.86126  ORF Transcript_42598/g.86126 Transcript_42598/m.86126 type:complete len:228 (-) Transcript_42598:321-1004(-)
MTKPLSRNSMRTILRRPLQTETTRMMPPPRKVLTASVAGSVSGSAVLACSQLCWSCSACSRPSSSVVGAASARSASPLGASSSTQGTKRSNTTCKSSSLSCWTNSTLSSPRGTQPVRVRVAQDLQTKAKERAVAAAVQVLVNMVSGRCLHRHPCLRPSLLAITPTGPTMATTTAETQRRSARFPICLSSAVELSLCALSVGMRRDPPWRQTRTSSSRSKGSRTCRAR